MTKPDKNYLNEMRGEEADLDDFKKDRQIKLKKTIDNDEMNWDKPTSRPLPPPESMISSRTSSK